MVIKRGMRWAGHAAHTHTHTRFVGQLKGKDLLGDQA